MSHSPGVGNVFSSTQYGLYTVCILRSIYSEAQMEKPLRPYLDHDSIILDRHNDDMINKSSAITLRYPLQCYAVWK